MTHVPEPGVTLGNYVSYFCSPYHVWLCHLGYPQLDVNRYPDGEWEIIEFHNAPIIPALTRWKRVLTGIRNTEISYSFIKKFVHQCDPTRPEFWAREEAKTAAVYAEQDALDRHRDDSVEYAFQAIKRNEALMERIARKGMGEINLWNIRNNIPLAREPRKEKPWLT